MLLKNTLLKLIGGILGTVLGALEGIYLGAMIGGNFFQEVEFAGKVGYEATGLLGFIICTPLGLVIGIYLMHKFIQRKKPGSN